MGISVKTHPRVQSTTYLGNRMLPGQTFTGAINVTNKVPMKTITKVILYHTSKKLGSDDIFTNHEVKFKQEELRIVFKSSIIIIK